MPSDSAHEVVAANRGVALWRFNGWSDPEECRFECMTHPELSRVVGMMRDYWYVRHARELAERGE